MPGRNKYLALPLALTALLVAAAFFLPGQLSRMGDGQLVDTVHVIREDGERSDFSDSIRLSVPEKLLLLRSGNLSAVDLEAANSEVRVAYADGEVFLYESEEPLLDSPEEAEQVTQEWSQRLESAQRELRALRQLGGLPQFWSQEDTVELTGSRRVLYIDTETQVSFVVDYMTLSASPYALNLTVDEQTGRILSLSMRWEPGEAPNWGLSGAANFGGAWRDYWGMDGVDAAWNSEYIKGILVDTEDLIRVNGDYTSLAEVIFTYDGQKLSAPLYCWARGGKGCGVQWNEYAIKTQE